MTPPTLDQLIRRVVGAAHDAGVAVAGRPRADHARSREEQVAYAVALLTGHIERELERRQREDAACAAG